MVRSLSTATKCRWNPGRCVLMEIVSYSYKNACSRERYHAYQECGLFTQIGARSSRLMLFILAKPAVQAMGISELKNLAVGSKVRYSRTPSVASSSGTGAWSKLAVGSSVTFESLPFHFAPRRVLTIHQSVMLCL